MKITIDTLKDTFKLGYETYKDSRNKAIVMNNYYHNRQFNSEQLAVLRGRGQPAETFNIIKLYTRQLQGYYSTTVNSVKLLPVQESDTVIAGVLNDVLKHIDTANRWSTEGDLIKLDLFLTGMCVSYTNVKERLDALGEAKRDKFGRIIYDVTKEHVKVEEVVLDPTSIKSDYSDSRFIHRFKWMTREAVIEAFGIKVEDKLDTRYNFLDAVESEYGYSDTSDSILAGSYRYFDEYLIVHTIMKDDKGIPHSIHWSGETILHKVALPFKEMTNPYTVVKLHDSNKKEYYSLFSDVKESQDAINQAIIQVQMLANTNKILLENGAVTNVTEFTESFQRVNSVTQVNALAGVKIINLSGDVLEQYAIIDKALNRVQRLLGINDSFLGQAFASDSGRKVKLQQGATMMALRYINNKLELFYELEGTKTVQLVKQYYRANQIMRVVDEYTTNKWIELNKPIINPETGEPYYEEYINPASGEIEEDSQGNSILVPINYKDTDIEFSEVDITMETVSYNDEEEKNQQLIETVIGGNMGQALLQVNPAGYMQISALAIKSTNSKYSMDIAKVLLDTSEMLTPQPEKQDTLGQTQLGGQKSNSQSTKLPSSEYKD